ncbi:MAG: DUF434 domain-containing protein [Sediminispirochaetaceae bacterium]
MRIFSYGKMPDTESAAMRRPLESPQFEAAARDYLWLLDRGYPERRSRELTADRYRLDTHQRSALYRGVFSTEESAARGRNRLELPLQSPQGVTVDFLNLLLLLMNYLYGRNVFFASDGFARDDGENFSRFDNIHILRGALGLIRTDVPQMGFDELRLLIDSEPKTRLPVSSDGGLLLQLLKEELSPLSGEFLLRANPDGELVGLREGLICSSDTGVLDRTTQRAVDIGGYILRQRYGDKLTDIRRIIGGGAPLNM